MTTSFAKLAQPREEASLPIADRKRFEALAVREFDFVWRSLRRLGVPADGVADAAQQVWMVAARKLESIAPDRERAFLFGTAVRIASNTRRSGARRARIFEDGEGDAPDPAPTQDALLDDRRARKMLDEAILALSDDVREIFVLFECEELSSVEIAAILEIPIGTVSSRLRRAREEFSTIARRMRGKLDIAKGGGTP